MAGCLIFQRPDICSTTSFESIRTSSRASGSIALARLDPLKQSVVLGDVVGRDPEIAPAPRRVRRPSPHRSPPSRSPPARDYRASRHRPRRRACGTSDSRLRRSHQDGVAVRAQQHVVGRGRADDRHVVLVELQAARPGHSPAQQRRAGAVTFPLAFVEGEKILRQFLGDRRAGSPARGPARSTPWPSRRPVAPRPPRCSAATSSLAACARAWSSSRAWMRSITSSSISSRSNCRLCRLANSVSSPATSFSDDVAFTRSVSRAILASTTATSDSARASSVRVSSSAPETVASRPSISLRTGGQFLQHGVLRHASCLVSELLQPGVDGLQIQQSCLIFRTGFQCHGFLTLVFCWSFVLDGAVLLDNDEVPRVGAQVADGHGDLRQGPRAIVLPRCRATATRWPSATRR